MRLHQGALRLAFGELCCIRLNECKTCKRTPDDNVTRTPLSSCKPASHSLPANIRPLWCCLYFFGVNYLEWRDCHLFVSTKKLKHTASRNVTVNRQIDAGGYGWVGSDWANAVTHPCYELRPLHNSRNRRFQLGNCWIVAYTCSL